MIIEPVLELQNITKQFGNVYANKNVSLTLFKGEILSVLGENGSGKTSLMNVPAGIYQQDSGKIYVKGHLVNILSPEDAFKNRIGMIHQHFKLVDDFTASENVALALTDENNKEHHQKYVDRLNKAIERLGSRKDIKTQIKSLESKLDSLPKSEKVLVKEQIEKLKDDLIILKLAKQNEIKARKFNLKIISERIKDVCDSYGFVVDPNKHVYDMSVSEKQTLEIVKVLIKGVDILILDEPTAVLTPQETKQLFKVLKNMSLNGKSIIIITHKLNEVLEISNRVVVLRKGENVGEVLTKDADESLLTEMMVGKKVELNIERSEPNNPKKRLEVKNVSFYDGDGKKVLDNVSFDVNSGEILGIAGISGSGQKELLDIIAGINKVKEGEIVFINPKKNLPVTFFHKTLKQIKKMAEDNCFHKINGEPFNCSCLSNKEIVETVNNSKVLFNDDEIINLKNKNPLEIRELGIHLSFVPEDRLGMGLVGDMDLVDNVMLRSYKKTKKYSPTFVDRDKPTKLANKIVDELEVVTPSLFIPVKKLSGGNIQKVLVGRELAYAPKVFMAAYPVRGLDINSSYVIYNILQDLKNKGVAVIYVGEDLDVLLALCDKIIVLSNGKVTANLDARNTNKEEVGRYMLQEGAL